MPLPRRTLQLLIALLLLMIVGSLSVFNLILADSSQGGERRLAVPEDRLVAVELATVAVVPMTGTPVVLLRDPEGGRSVPIFIGPNEARAILSAQRGLESPRPMTHDLLVKLLDGLDGVLEKVVIDRLEDSTYFGALVIHHNGRERLIDSRPSDAMAMAVRVGAPILVAPDILEAGADIPFEGLGEDDRVTALGITVGEANEALREALNLPDDDGVLVSAVDGLAALTGLQPGAFITEVDERPVQNPMNFLEQVNAAEGDQARIRFWLDGEFQEIDIETRVPRDLIDRRQRRTL
ncbi:MAG: bifunctional nuclease domain-containing protein [Wenzhouxiangella sp.]